MLPLRNAYNSEIPEIGELKKISTSEITMQLENYLAGYNDSFVRSQQIKYFESFVKGLISNLDRKSIEPIALSFLGEKEVRGMQQFFTRSRGWDEALLNNYKTQLSTQISSTKGFLSVDESDFVKKGNDSAGVMRQYCGRLGKTENCQAGVFFSYASEKGIGIVDSKLYLPKRWFDDDYAQKRIDCQIPEEVAFKTKNEIAKEMLKNILDSQLLEIECIGCDASFGSDHTFLDSLPKSLNYFAAVRENENIFREMPSITVPENSKARGGKFKHPRAAENPVAIKTIIDDGTIPWVKRVIADGAKGSITAEIKCLRCVSSRKENRLFLPKAEVWVYIRRHEDGKIKYFVSNMPDDVSLDELDRLATARWSIEQCFQECKSYLGMTHYEARSFQAWHRHMLFVVIAHLFITVLRQFLKKIRDPHHANDTLYHCFADSHSDQLSTHSYDCALSFAS